MDRVDVARRVDADEVHIRERAPDMYAPHPDPYVRQGRRSGAAVGAATGAIIGNNVKGGNAWGGAAIGAAVGGMAGDRRGKVNSMYYGRPYYGRPYPAYRY